MMDTSGFCRHIGKLREGSLAHLVIPLIVIFKGGNVRRHHLQAVVNNTYSRLNVRWWLDKLNYKLIRELYRNGHA